MGVRIRTSSGSHQSGFTLMEVLIASLLATVVLMGLVRLWQFSYGMTLATDDRGVAYNLARQAIEKIRTTGFAHTAEGASTRYFGGDGLNETQNPTADSRYRMNIVVTTDRFITNTQTGAQEPAPLALRQVGIQVLVYPSGTVLHTTGCTLSRSGI